MKISLTIPPLMDVKDNILSPISMNDIRTCPSYGIDLLAAILRKKGPLPFSKNSQKRNFVR